MGNRACAIQFTGGRDSTLVAIKLAESLEFDEIHLLTFKTDLMSDLDKVKLNVDKLNRYFNGTTLFIHRIIETQDLLKELYHRRHFRSIFRFGSYHVATFCPSCRLSHHAHTIVYCLQNGIENAADGINELTGFDLFQQRWAVERIQGLYQSYGIEYITPILEAVVSSEVVLREYNSRIGVSQTFFESQPKCLGGGQFHNLYLRCYYLSRRGKDAYIRKSLKWIDYSMGLVIGHIDCHLGI